MPTTDEDATAPNTIHTTGTVEWFDAERGVGTIRPDDGTSPCAVSSATLRDCGIGSLSAGDRVRFRVHEKDDERTATDLTLLRAMQRWENEGGAIRPDDAIGASPANDDLDA